jgi:putative heme-binding domain-containing protein
MNLRLLPLLAFFTLRSLAAEKKDPFAELVRPTEPLTPEQERAAFHLPPGFEIQLVASEPDLRKPMNMQWDALGRLWITESREYPFPVKDGSPGRDTVRIFSDFGPDGRARKVEIFADGLNIPTGLYPFRSRRGNEAGTSKKSGAGEESARLLPSAATETWKCIVWSIPNIWLLEDTDGDGKADRREVLYGPLGWERDTHGNLSSFRRGADGWLYGTHGFNNESTLRGRDGSELKIQSGNTWRIRLDGSRVEGNTWGQVNPFGLCWDNRGNLFSADCHSSPIYQLLRGAYYPSFGKPHDGLGFGPTTITHSHGSTAICAPMYVCDPAWPAEWQDHMFVGNVQTSRINHDAITWHGSSSKGKEMPDFVSTDDPWFRPVDLSWGPDGALYVADFYNRIIGHYEVPLTHPGRDRERGRLWRIVWRGEKNDATARRSADSPVRGEKNSVILSGAPSSASETARNEGPRGKHDGVKSPGIASGVSGLIHELASTNLTRRTLALNELCDAHGTDALPAIKAALAAPVNAFQKLNAVWALHRLGSLDEATLIGALQDKDPLVRVHAAKVAAEGPGLRQLAAALRGPRLAAGGGELVGKPTDEKRQQAAAVRDALCSALTDPDPFVRRAASDALAAHPAAENVAPLLARLRTTKPDDDHLIHATRIALRNQLRDPAVLADLTLGKQNAEERALVLDLLLAASGEAAAEFRMNFFENQQDLPGVLFTKHLPTLARNLSAARLESLFALAQRKLGRDPEELAAGLDALLSALDQRGIPPGATLRTWGPQIVTALLTPGEPAAVWTNSPADGGAPSANPWGIEERTCADGVKFAFMSSFPHGEKLTGTLRSPAFPLPATLSFFLCGHDGSPGKPAAKTNFVRLRDAQSNAVLREAAPPRHDIAQKVIWDLADCAGKRSVIEITDGNIGSAYAWLAVARFEPELRQLRLAAPEAASRRMQTAADLIRTLKLTGFEPALTKLAFSAAKDADTRAAAARALLGAGAKDVLTQIAAVITDATASAPLREKFALALAEVKSFDAIATALSTAPRRLQQSLATILASSREGGELLLAACAEGKAPALLLRDKPLVDRLKAAKVPNLEARIAKLTANLPAANVEIDRLIATRAAAFDPTKADAGRGAEVFTRNCAVCHIIEGKGGLLGPQLDGIGGRGSDRLLEDILDPNRNVDRAFRMNVVTLKSGTVVAGLPRREEGEQLIMADAAGQETRVAKADIAERKETETSLMPPTFGEIIPPEELNDLLAFLLGKRPAK